MKAKLKTTFDNYGKYVVGHIEDTQTYKDVKSGLKKWEVTAYHRSGLTAKPSVHAQVLSGGNVPATARDSFRH